MTFFLAKYEENAIVFSSVINNVPQDHSQELELRTYAIPMEPTHQANELPPSAVERLMAVTEEHYPWRGSIPPQGPAAGYPRPEKYRPVRALVRSERVFTL